MTARDGTAAQEGTVEPAVTAGGATRAAGEGRPSWSVSLAVLAAVVGIVVVVLLSPTDGLQADRSQHYLLAVPSEPVAAGAPFVTEIEPAEDGLSGVSVAFATYLGALDCTVDVTLREGGEPVAAERVSCGDLPDNDLTAVLTTSPLAGSAGRTYALEVALVPGSRTGGPAVWLDPSGAPVVVLAYGGSGPVAGHLGEVAERIGVFGPPWATTGGWWLLGAVAAVAVVLVVRLSRWAVPALLLLVLVRGLLWAALLPPLMGMDEGAHFANVQFIAEEGRLPDRSSPLEGVDGYSDSIDVVSEALHVNYLAQTDRPDYLPEERRRVEALDAAAGTVASGAGAAAGYPPPYYVPPALLYAVAPDSTVDQVALVRLWSVLLGVVAALAGWWAARAIFPGSRGAQLAVVAAAALHPMVAHQSAIVNNDIWVIAAGAVACGLGVRLVRGGGTPAMLLAAGAVVGGAALGKPYGVAVGIPLAVGWCLGVVRDRRWRPARLARDVGLVLLGLAVTYGLWLVVARLLGIVTTNGFPADSGAEGPRTPAAYVGSQLDEGVEAAAEIWVHQLWGVFGWVNAPLPEGTFRVLEVGTVAVGVLLLLWVVVLLVPRWRRAGPRGLDPPVVVCASFVVGTVALLYVIELLYFRATGTTDLLQGRYALMVVPALLALPGLLLARLSAGRLPAAVTTTVVALGVLAVHLQAVTVVGEHFYG